MDHDDVVDPGDAAFQALLAHAAEQATDDAKRDMLIDGILTFPSMRDWPPEWRETVSDSCRYVMGLADEMRRRQRRR